MRAAGQAEPGYGTAVETEAQGLADAGPAGGDSAGAGRGYWWHTGPGLKHCSRLGVEAGDG